MHVNASMYRARTDDEKIIKSSAVGIHTPMMMSYAFV
jgi:hypothetical protein